MKINKCNLDGQQRLGSDGLTYSSQRNIMMKTSLYIVILLFIFVNPQFQTVGAAEEPIRLQLSGKHQFEFAGYYAAKELGYYEQLGREVIISEYQDSMDVIEDVISGRVDFAATSSSATQSYLEGKPIRLLANIFKHSINGSDLYGDGLIASTSLCETDPDLVRYFRDVSLVGWYYALSHTEEMVDLILEKYSSAKSKEALLHEAQETIKLVDAESFLVGSVDLQRLQLIAEGLVESGIEPSSGPLERFIFDQVNPLEIDSSEMELSSPRQEPDRKLTVISIVLILIALVVLIYAIIKISRIARIRARLKAKANREGYVPIILAVDDAPAILDTLTELLKEKYKVKVAPNGDIALKIARAPIPPDLILLDVMMPGKSGFDVARELQGDEATREIPIIFVTGRTDEESISEGYRVGGVDYVPKPFNPDELLARVETHLNLRDVRDQVEEISRSLDE